MRWDMVHPQEDLGSLMAAGAEIGPDIIYARGVVPTVPIPDPNSFDRKDFSLVLFEIGFCKDLGCQDKLTTKAKKYHPLLCILR